MAGRTRPTALAERTVATAHRASYADPIRVGADDALRPTGRSDLWDGHRWLWAVGPDGREGWVPDELVAAERGETVALADYSAAELGCEVGERLICLAERHGWVLCRNMSGSEGWVPARNLTSAG